MLGNTNAEVEKYRKLYGTNHISNVKTNSFFKLLLESLGDPIIKILLIALAIKVIFLFKDFDYFETLGILIAIFLASFISTISEYGSEAAFRRLQEESSKLKVKVMREGVLKEILIEEVVVHDLIVLQSGDKIPADGYLVEGELSVDESSLNGEAKEAKKYPPFGSRIEEKNKLFRGSVVYSGNAKMIVTEVGDKTIYGALAREVSEQSPTSPLKLRLAGLAKFISKIGYIGAIFVTFSYLFSVIVIDNHFNPDLIMETLTNFRVMFDHFIYALTLSVTIIVVAVPEGLPMMITLVLSSNMKRMLKSNVLVRKLVGIETAGSINVLLTDKTGTLTKGKLEVSEVITGDNTHFKSLNQMKTYAKYYQTFYECLFYNNESSFNVDGYPVGGNQTDKAVLSFLKIDKNIQRRVVLKIPFTSQNKFSKAKLDNGCVYIKGAAEKLMPNITYYLNKNGEEKVLLHKKQISMNIEALTKKGIRVLVLCYEKRDQGSTCYVFIGLVAIRDELREEAKEGVRLIKSAGIRMIMITGDAKDTAISIAKDVGLFERDDLVLTSDEMSILSDEELKKRIGRLCVVARALPTDKSRLVRLLEEMGQVVGMTGDGVNDAPALKKADVGFAMGSGTEVAKEASDIVILDDNILSISKAILYGRTIFKSIRKFIIYQLTVNMCALILSIVGPFIGINTPITIIQMLWLNMIMDTFAGLAFSFEPALKSYMNEPPKRKDEPIVNSYMIGEVLFTGLYSALICILFLKLPIVREYIRVGENYKYLMTAYFALFIFIGVFNSFNARSERINILANLGKNKVFILIIAFILSVQVYLIYHGGNLFRTYGLTAKEFFIVLLLAMTVFPVDFLRKTYLRRHHLKTGV